MGKSNLEMEDFPLPGFITRGYNIITSYICIFNAHLNIFIFIIIINISVTIIIIIIIIILLLYIIYAYDYFQIYEALEHHISPPYTHGLVKTRPCPILKSPTQAMICVAQMAV